MGISNDLTAGQMMRELAQEVGDLIWDGTTTSGTTTTAVDASVPANSDDDENMIGAWWYGVSGTGQNQERILVSPYTATSGTMTFDRAATNPSADTGYIVTRKYRPTHIMRAIQAAQRHLGQGRPPTVLVPVLGRELVLGSALPNNFDLFTTANVPDGLTLDGNSTFTSQTTVTAGGRRGLRMVTDGTNAGSVRYAIPRWGRFNGRSILFRVLLRASVAARVTIEISDGVSTATTKTVSTNNAWELLEISRAVSAAATQLQVSIEVSSGVAVTVDLSYWFAGEPLAGYTSQPLDADRNLVYVGRVRVSEPISAIGYGGYDFFADLADDAWEVVEDMDDTPRLFRAHVTGLQGRVLEYQGYRRMAEATGPSVSIPVPPELLLPRARYFLHRDYQEREQAADALAEAMDVEKRLRVQVPRNGFKRVQGV